MCLFVVVAIATDVWSVGNDGLECYLWCLSLLLLRLHRRRYEMEPRPAGSILELRFCPEFVFDNQAQRSEYSDNGSGTRS